MPSGNPFSGIQVSLDNLAPITSLWNKYCIPQTVTMLARLDFVRGILAFLALITITLPSCFPILMNIWAVVCPFCQLLTKKKTNSAFMFSHSEHYLHRNLSFLSTVGQEKLTLPSYFPILSTIWTIILSFLSTAVWQIQRRSCVS